MLAHSLLFLKSTKRATRLNVPIRRTNCYQQYFVPSQQICCGRVWNLIQACDVQSSDWKMHISTLPSSEVENFLSRRGPNPEPAEPEADMLPSEPARRAYTYGNVRLNLTYSNKRLIFLYVLRLEE